MIENGHLLALGLGRRVRTFGDLELLVKVDRVVDVEEPLPVWDITQRTGKVRDTVEATLLSGGLLGDVGGQATLSAIQSARPELRGAIEDLVAAAAARQESLHHRDVQLREQRDALALGLEIAGFDSAVAAAPPISTDASATIPYLSAFANRIASSEATLIRHDQSHFDDWQRIDGEIYDVLEFVDPDNSARRVTVLYADKEGLERVTGTDLIYYSAHSPGFVLVQYKRMENVAQDDDEEGGWLYRPDGQLGREIERMKRLKTASTHTSDLDWRLSSEPFYMKLVQSTLARPRGGKLARGMYFPLSLFELVLKSKSVQGPRGGVAIGWNNVQRYLTNTDFVRLVQGGWIGSQGQQTVDIADVINASIGIGRGVVAVRDDTPSTRQRQRQRQRPGPRRR